MVPVWRMLVVSLITVGSHVFKAFFTILSIYLIHDNFFSINEYGLLLSIEATPALLVPIFLGAQISTYISAVRWMRFAMVLCTCALIFVWIALLHNHRLAFIISIFLFGCFSCMLSPIQRTIIKYEFQEHAAVASGIFISISNVSKIVGKLSVVPIVVRLFENMNILVTLSSRCKSFIGSYKIAFGFPCMISFIIAVAAGFADSPLRERQARVERSSSVLYIEDGDEPCLLSVDSEADFQELHGSGMQLQSQLALIPYETYILIVLHTIYVIIFHAIVNFLPVIAVDVWHMSAHEASVLVSIPPMIAIVLCPLVGLLLRDRHHQHIFSFLAGIITAMAYTLLLLDQGFIVVVLLLLAVAQSTLFTILLALVATHTPSVCVGCAYGLVEVTNAIADIVGNLFFGWLLSIRLDGMYGFCGSFVSAWIGCLVLLLLSYSELKTAVSSWYCRRTGYTRIIELQQDASATKPATIARELYQQPSHNIASAS